MPLLKFLGVFFKEHPLTSYDVQIHFCFSWKHFFMGRRRGMFHSTLSLNSVCLFDLLLEIVVDETGVDELGINL